MKESLCGDLVVCNVLLKEEEEVSESFNPCGTSALRLSRCTRAKRQHQQLQNAAPQPPDP
jgi:hypothetical protein